MYIVKKSYFSPSPCILIDVHTCNYIIMTKKKMFSLGGSCHDSSYLLRILAEFPRISSKQNVSKSPVVVSLSNSQMNNDGIIKEQSKNNHVLFLRSTSWDSLAIRFYSAELSGKAC